MYQIPAIEAAFISYGIKCMREAVIWRGKISKKL